MGKCFFCELEFKSSKPKTMYCSSRCRTYAHRAKKDVKAMELKYFVDDKNIKHKFDEELLLRLCREMGIFLNKEQPQISQGTEVIKPPRIVEGIDLNKKDVGEKNAPKINYPKFVVEEKDDIFDEEVENVQEMEEVDYRKIYQDCQFPDEYKSLWERIKADPMLSDKQKNEWKLNLNAK